MIKFITLKRMNLLFKFYNGVKYCVYEDIYAAPVIISLTTMVN